MWETLLYWVSHPMVSLYAQLMLKWKVARHGPLPEGRKIIVANHPSTSDPFFVALAAQEPATILITEKAFNVPLFGTYLRRSGHIPVIPGQGREAFERAKALLEADRTLILFPEGTLSPYEGGLARPHTGAARLALLTDAPVIPVGIHLFWKRLRHIHGKIGGKWTESRWPLRGPYAMTIGQPLYFNGDVDDRGVVVEIAERIMDNIAHLMQQSQGMLGKTALNFA